MMNISDIKAAINQILDAERANPTVQYQSKTPFLNQAAAEASALAQRGWHPRPVSENPGYFHLQCRNYDLLQNVFWSARYFLNQYL
jgi:hypothetical protein